MTYLIGSIAGDDIVQVRANIGAALGKIAGEATAQDVLVVGGDFDRETVHADAKTSDATTSTPMGKWAGKPSASQVSSSAAGKPASPASAGRSRSSNP
jgi:hypothetical protein